MSPLTRFGRRRHALDQPFPDAWRDLLRSSLVHWSLLDDGERAELEDLIRIFLVDKRWQAANGLTLTDEIRVQISAAHEIAQLETAVAAFTKVGKQLGVIA